MSPFGGEHRLAQSDGQKEKMKEEENEMNNKVKVKIVPLMLVASFLMILAPPQPAKAQAEYAIMLYTQVTALGVDGYLRLHDRDSEEMYWTQIGVVEDENFNNWIEVGISHLYYWQLWWKVWYWQFFVTYGENGVLHAEAWTRDVSYTPGSAVYMKIYRHLAGYHWVVVIGSETVFSHYFGYQWVGTIAETQMEGITAITAPLRRMINWNSDLRYVDASYNFVPWTSSVLLYINSENYIGGTAYFDTNLATWTL